MKLSKKLFSVIFNTSNKVIELKIQYSNAVSRQKCPKIELFSAVCTGVTARWIKYFSLPFNGANFSFTRVNQHRYFLLLLRFLYNSKHITVAGNSFDLLKSFFWIFLTLFLVFLLLKKFVSKCRRCHAIAFSSVFSHSGYHATSMRLVPGLFSGAITLRSDFQSCLLYWGFG